MGGPCPRRGRPDWSRSCAGRWQRAQARGDRRVGARRSVGCRCAPALGVATMVPGGDAGSAQPVMRAHARRSAAIAAGPVRSECVRSTLAHRTTCTVRRARRWTPAFSSLAVAEVCAGCAFALGARPWRERPGRQPRRRVSHKAPVGSPAPTREGRTTRNDAAADTEVLPAASVTVTRAGRPWAAARGDRSGPVGTALAPGSPACAGSRANLAPAAPGTAIAPAGLHAPPAHLPPDADAADLQRGGPGLRGGEAESGPATDASADRCAGGPTAKRLGSLRTPRATAPAGRRQGPRRWWTSCPPHRRASARTAAAPTAAACWGLDVDRDGAGDGPKAEVVEAADLERVRADEAGVWGVDERVAGQVLRDGPLVGRVEGTP